MSIKKFFATKDTTITNAFKSDLTTRGTEGNMGNSDVLETFSIFAQVNTGSIEKARILIDFPLTEISSSRKLGTSDLKGIPVSGGVKFYLRMFNAEHTQTVPNDFVLSILPISRSWDEGRGLDMESYLHKDSANWVSSSNANVAQQVKINFNSSIVGSYDDGYVSLFDGNKNRFNFYFNDGNDTAPDNLIGEEVEVNIAGAGNINAVIAAFNTAVNARAEFTSSYDVSNNSDRHVKVINVVSASSDNPIVSTHLKSLNPDQIVTTVLLSGSNATFWSNTGGDYRDLTYVPGETVPNYSYSMTSGIEDLELDITELVEEWLANLDGAAKPISGSLRNYGLGIMMSGAFEDGTLKRSYYTKKFFARSSEYFFRRPVIEARWDASISDDRSRIRTSNSQLSNADNTYNLYYYNWVNGQLKDFPNSATPTFALTTDKTLTNKVTLATDAIGVTLDGVIGKKITPPGANVDISSPNITDATLTINDGSSSRVLTFKNDAPANDSQVNLNSAPASTVVATRLATAVNGSSGGAVAVTAKANGKVIELTHDSGGTITITSSSANVGTSFPVTDLTLTASNISSTKTSTGTYRASFIVPTNITASTLYEKWWVNNETTGLIKGQSGTSPVNVVQFYNANSSIVNSGVGPQDQFITTITNLKESYSRDERIKLRVYSREDNWQPNIYSTAQSKAPVYPIISGYYKVQRESDSLEIIKYSTGSLAYSKMSYDSHGNYLDLDMSLFEPDYTYIISFLYNINGSYVEQKERYKFRVHK